MAIISAPQASLAQESSIPNASVQNTSVQNASVQNTSMPNTSMQGASLQGTSALAYASDLPVKALTKAPPLPVAPKTCSEVPEFLLSNCVLSWYGITVYGTVDMGVGYQTHGAPFDKDFVTGASYFIQKMNRSPMFGLAPNGLSQSTIGIKGTEAIAPGWNFIFDLAAGFDPYSGQLSNSPQSLVNNNGVPLNQQSVNGDSSRAGQFYNGVGYLGVSSPIWGTLTFFRQNSLTLDGVNAYDPMGGSNAFSPIGFSGTTAGAGDTELARYSTAVKYRLEYGPFRVAGLYQYGHYDLNNPSNGAWEAQIGGDIKNLGPGTLSLDGIYTFAKDAVSLGISSAASSLSQGVPVYPYAQGALTATISNQTSVMGLAKYSAGPWKIFAGYEWIQFAPPSDNQFAFTDIDGTRIGAIFGNNTATSNLNYTAQCGTGICSDKILQVAWTGFRYAVNDSLDVMGAFYHYDQNQFSTTNCSNAIAHSQCHGVMNAVSAAIDWRFAPKWDAYLGLMFSEVDGGLANGYLARSNLDPTVGVRFRF